MNFGKVLRNVLFLCLSLQMVFPSPMTVIYWGQDSNGGEQDLRDYCMDSTFDIIVIAFVYDFPTASGSTFPGMNFAGHCGDTFSKSNPLLLDCASTIGDDITYCQQQGKKIMISLGGAEGKYGFTSDSQAQTFATTVWNLFLGGTSTTRPFGTAVVDGVDLDIEKGASTSYSAFITALRGYFATASKQYYISSAPQCPYPDEWMGPGAGTPLDTAWFDYVWVQFYNNDCGLDHYPHSFNFDSWATWASTTAVNPDVKVFIGAPASAEAAGTGYVSLSTLQTISTATHASYPNVFGGVMLWDCSNSDQNNNFGGEVATFLHQMSSAGSTPAPSLTTHSLTTAAHNQGTSSSSSGAHSSSTSSSGAHSSSSSSSSGAHSTTTTSSSSSSGHHSSTSSSSSSSGKHSTTTTSTSTSGSPSTSTSGSDVSCTLGNMRCTSTDSYQTCTNARDGTYYWATNQACQVGLSCQQAGAFVYCIDVQF